MTQRDHVLKMLRAAGSSGLSSDVFLAAHLPRAAARICELKALGYSISSEREGKFVRYRLNVGVESVSTERATLDSGAAASSSLLAPASEARARTIPSAYNDVWVEEAA